MNITMNGETRQRSLTTADLAASANSDVFPEVVDTNADGPKRGEDLAPLFSEGAAGDFRARWSIVQQGFVDDPKNAVRQGDEQGSTEDLRLALRRYRSFFDRLLSI
jgi:hypothetical protein